MMAKNKKLLMLATAAMVSVAVAVPGTFALAALTANIPVTASFVTALSIVKTVDMSFGNWDYGHSPIAGDEIALGTNDSAVPSANFVLNGAPGVQAAGQAAVTGVATFPVEIRCDTDATLTEAGGGLIKVTGIKVTNGAGAAYPAGSACAIATPVVFNLVAGAMTLKFGGKLDGSTAVGFVAGAYSTANTGGNNIEVNVVYQ